MHTTASAAHASPLGKTTTYCHERETCAPELLFPLARQEKRTELGLTAQTLPFRGFDLWNAYEISWLNPKGKPVVAVGEFCVPADSPYLIESKSLKLYLNSFNHAVFADAAALKQQLEHDLSMAAQASVSVDLRLLEAQPQVRIAYPEGVLLDTLDIDCHDYLPRPDLLHTQQETAREECLYSHLLKSNCLVTGQPDWAMLVVRYFGAPIDRAGLLRYIVSFRKHNEFHEQCVERIYCDILQRCAPQFLLVYARYTRRGGLDINPYRSNRADWLSPDMAREVRQ
ncbi:NADPH-dependent 7-cyano-7-deazaguanine reductase QueF [Azonexus sp.]|uniref:NADPH-dependent 7-cyano-7-deazaguanine reductase QueF n=1 Tax=Azonexus sp. TaxID=1872668 RepID=UPI0039E2A741